MKNQQITTVLLTTCMKLAGFQELKDSFPSFPKTRLRRAGAGILFLFGALDSPRRLPPRRRGAGVQNFLNSLDSRFHGNDRKGRFRTFCESVKVWLFEFESLKIVSDFVLGISNFQPLLFLLSISPALHIPSSVF